MSTLCRCFLICILSFIHAEESHTQWIQTSEAEKPSGLQRIIDSASLPSTSLSARHGLKHPTLIRCVELTQGVIVAQPYSYQSLGPFADSLTNQIIWTPFDAGTIAVQTLTWAGSVAVGFPVGVLAAFAGGAPAAYVLWAIAPPVGVYLGGKWMGGNGTFSLAFFGSIPGTLLLILARDEALVYTAIPLSLLGTLLGYHLSASLVYETQGGQYSRPQPPLDPSSGLHARLRLISVSIKF